MNDLPIVRIEWDDSTDVVRWYTRDDLTQFDVKHCVSVGYLLHESDTALYIVQSDDRDEEESDRHFNNTMIIPKVSVTKREVIR